MDHQQTAAQQPGAAKAAPINPQHASPNESLKYSSAVLHPVDKIQRESEVAQAITKRKLKANVYGSALPMRIMMNEHMLSQCQRLPGLPSSYAGLDSYTGRDETIDFDDFLNLPEDLPDIPRQDPRDTLEQTLNIKSASTLQ